MRRLSAEAMQTERVRRRMERDCHISQSDLDLTAHHKARRHVKD